MVSISPLYRYWMVPSFWRRWPVFVRLFGSMLCISVSLSLAAIPLVVWLPNKGWKGWDGYFAELIYAASLIPLGLFLVLAGSLTIAPEREKQTWESLYLTPLGVAAIVRAKLFCRMARCALPIIWSLPFWVAWGYEVLTVNQAGPADRPDAATPVRLTIFLSWLSLRTLGHVLPCVSLGMLISAYCRKGRAAMIIAVAAVVGYGSLAWTISAIATTSSQTVSTLLYWPLLPVDWSGYGAGDLVSARWNSDVIADVVWMGILPLLCYWLTVQRCRKLTP